MQSINETVLLILNVCSVFSVFILLHGMQQLILETEVPFSCEQLILSVRSVFSVSILLHISSSGAVK
jgi:hypothetical protein